MLEFKDLSKSFDGGKSFAVRDLDLHVDDGEILILLGSSGCGKSTLLKMILRLIEPTSGTITVDGTSLAEVDPIAWRRSIGYVFQAIGLFPHMTVERNVAMGLELAGTPLQARRDRAHELLDLVGLPPDEYAGRFPSRLSGGQQQRVGVARALATDPAYLMMDEPFGALDALTRDSLQQEVRQLNKRLGKTMIFVTHDIFEAITLGDRIAVMHSGNLEQVGTAEEVIGQPATPFVKELFGKPAQQLAAFRDVLN